MLLSNGLASDPRVEKEASVLARAGHDVAVVAWNRDGGLAAEESRDGFRIVRVGPRAAYGAGLANMTRFRGFWRQATDRAIALDPQVVHCHDLDTAPAGMSAARATGAKLVLDFHELYRETRMVPSNRLVRPFALGAVDLVERRAMRRADLVLVANPPTLDYYRRRTSATVVDMPNAPDAEMFRPAVGPRPDRPFTVCYVGQKRYARQLKMLVDIVGRNEGLAAILAGGGVAAKEIAEYAEGVPRVEVVGQVRYAEIPAFYARSDAVWAIYETAVGNARYAYYVKALEGMACGLPIVIDRRNALGELAAEKGAGLAVDGADEAAVEAAVLALADDPDTAAAMGRAGRHIIESGLNWAAASQRLVEAYEALE
jgi:glycosyltransferase involved in cell wall biosynthesis